MPAGTGPVVAPAKGSAHDRCLQDLALLFKSLQLIGNSQPGSIGDNVYAKSLAELSDVNLPAIIVCCEGGEELLDQENFEERSWGYPCSVLIVDSTSVLDPNIRPDFLAWRRALMVLVDNLPLQQHPLLPNTPEVWNLTLRPRSIFEEQSRSGVGNLPSNMVLVTSFLVLCHANESRSR